MYDKQPILVVQTLPIIVSFSIMLLQKD